MSECPLKNKENGKQLSVNPMKYEQSRTILSAQSAEESMTGKRKAKSLQWKELNNLLQDQQLLSGSISEISQGNERLFREEF